MNGRRKRVISGSKTKNPRSFGKEGRADEEMLFCVQTAGAQTGIVFIRNSGE